MAWPAHWRAQRTEVVLAEVKTSAWPRVGAPSSSGENEANGRGGEAGGAGYRTGTHRRGRPSEEPAQPRQVDLVFPGSPTRGRMGLGSGWWPTRSRAKDRATWTGGQ